VSQAGQASVELVAGSVSVLLAALVALQLLAAGYGAVMAGHAAESAALAIAARRPPEAAARDAVPGWPERSVRVRHSGGSVTVELLPPSPLRFVRKRLSVTARAAVREPAP
jgi:hypothetical protein